MKKNFLLFIVLFAFCSIKAQAQSENDANSYQKNNEIKLNIISPLLDAFEVGYERFLNKRSSLGISALKVYEHSSNDDMNYYISPYYRYYFGKKYASGFLPKDLECSLPLTGKKYMKQIKLHSLKVKTFMTLH